jgi:Calcineurin-like phosphoesterase
MTRRDRDRGETRPFRTFIIGDIHGCFDELLALEDAARELASKEGASAFFVSVGDLVDRGPKVREVVEHVMNGVVSGTHACVGGNHEAFLAETILDLAPWNFQPQWPLPSKLALYSAGFEARFNQEGKSLGMDREEFSELSRIRWMRCGGRETLTSFGCDPDNFKTWKIDRKLLAFLVGLPLMWESQSAIVTHALATRVELLHGFALSLRATNDPAGFHEGLSLYDQRVLDGLLWCRDLPTDPPAFGRLHVTGHTPLERPYLDEITGVVNVDTACVFGGTLTALCVETREFLSVPGWKTSPFA